LFDNIVNVLLGRPSFLEFAFSRGSANYPTVTVYTNGDVSPADELTSTSDSIMNIDKNIFKNSFKDIFSAEIFGELSNVKNIPKNCDGCCWKYACRGGGSIFERFSSENRFLNKGVYCKVWESLFPIVAFKLLRHGHPKDELLKVLAGESECA
jgi:radical SAM protein with 4Fe4S-binding SPASM domain